jgi:phosphoesterase RecJ-like protein
MNLQNQYVKLLNVLKSQDRFLITTHTNPDHDGIGAEIGLDHLLRSIGKESIIVNPEVISEARRYLDPMGRILSVDSIRGNLHNGNHMIVGVDTGETRRIEHIRELIPGANLIFIDHHDTGSPDGKTLFQFASIGSSCEIIYELIELAEVPLPVDVANALYTGIIADTGSFRYGKTTPRTHEIAARLLAAGVSPQMMSEYLYSSSPVQRLYARRELYSSMKILEEERVVYFTLTTEMLQRIGISYDNLAGIVNEPLEAKNISCSILFFAKEPGITKLSIRSKSGIDMLPAATRYGGGGHKNACGATIPLDLDAAIREFIPWAVDCVKNTL